MCLNGEWAGRRRPAAARWWLHDVGEHDRSTMAQAQCAVAGRSRAAAQQKGETRCADAEAKTMDVFHFHVRASLCPGFLAFLWAIGLLYLQLTYMELGPLELEGPVPPHCSNPPGPGLVALQEKRSCCSGGGCGFVFLCAFTRHTEVCASLTSLKRAQFSAPGNLSDDTRLTDCVHKGSSIAHAGSCATCP